MAASTAAKHSSLLRTAKHDNVLSRQRQIPFGGLNTKHTVAKAAIARQQVSAAASRREVAVAAPLTLIISQHAAAAAAAAEALAEAPPAAGVSSPEASSSSSSSSSAPSPILQRFLDNEYELQVPSNFTFLETPIVRVERGPQPERSPVLARFEAPGGQPGSISILTRKANALKQTLFQVSDISQLGDPIEVAQLVLPRGSTLLATATLEVTQPPKETPLGKVEIPPQTYFTYEFTTPTGLHVALAAAARRGSVYICGASTAADRWQEAGPVFGQVVRSFRVRSQPTIS